MAVTQEKIDELKLRSVSNEIKNYTFKVEPKPGIIRYIPIEIGKFYEIKNSEIKINGRILKVLNFIYPLKADVNSAVPLGIQVQFLDNNKKGTYYNISDLHEVPN